MIQVLTPLLSSYLLPMAQRSEISQDFSLFCTDFAQHKATFPFPLSRHPNRHSSFLFLLLLLLQRVWMGQAVSPFETMGRRKMRGDDEGGPWVAPLPRAGHACSCSRGKILLIILCPLYVRRAWCGVGSHAGETSHRNALCSLPRRLAQSGARVGPRGRRCYIANSRSAV